ncbi:P-loop NTPase fold protein [Pseudomonas panipatensis]|uniref:KAP family P-loop domain-containing protein n=1 Tax=Pseudomonas panipatensis TaxID=428992 RepID=A0A1G8EMH1_9PSED|nr:P-loop NTPase fold protein [Pseudomonas panipatensis]SDH71065.1 KAP family P-loop domain-containing protein [Pseudomonas panipatensis]SMP68391.1 KAP family P-loop domain-containing protein [Pseudomonas panipatensis]
MHSINFHTEHPASRDVFPGGSHDKVATAIHGHLASATPSKVVGLDGEFGSGKSSILNMLKAKLTDADPDCRVWFFDCEQNYQGSTKSNFIELFTDQVLLEVPRSSKAEEALKASRDRALGRLFEYTKKTTSRVSAWALALVASLFFATTSFREIFAISRSSHAATTGTTPEASAFTSILHETSPWLIAVHCISLLSPVLILFTAKLWHWSDKDWSLLSLFKGSSNDRISEKIEVSKEVTPLDLKRTLLEQLKVVDHKRFVIILDNLDRLPKDNLRSVWSDLEIFIAVAAEAANLTVIVPFCSTKVAEYLKADGDRRYDAKDFIAKKFPVVFRAPPVITSGWKDGFRQLWIHTFASDDPKVIEQCAQLLQRHSPMVDNLVTPRLQKKFINDIATTALVVGDQISLLAIAAHLLLCKYGELSLVEILRTDGFSTEYIKKEEIETAQIELIKDTQVLLSAVIGDTMETGWQIQFLQIHYLTIGDIAIAELLDTPLGEAFARKDHEALVRLSSLFGFSDAIKRLLARRPVLASLLPTISAAHQAQGGEWISSLLDLLNTAQLDLFGESATGSEGFYEAFRYCRGQGLDGRLLMSHGDELEAKLEKILNSSFDQATLEPARLLLRELDLYLYAQDFYFHRVALKQAEYLMHLLPDIGNLRVIKASEFALDDSGLADAHLQLVTCPDHLLVPVPLSAECVVPALEWLYAERKFGNGLSAGIDATDVAVLAKFTGAVGEVESAVVGLALAENVDQTVGTAITTLLANNASPLIKAVAVITYIRQGDAEALAKIEDLDGVLESPVFRAFANATLYTVSLFELLSDEQVGESIAGFVAYLIREKRIDRLNCDWVTKHFSDLAQAVKPYVISEHELLSWLTPWDIAIRKSCQDIVKADVLLINCLLGPDIFALPKTRESLIGQLASEELTQEKWVQLISAGAKQHLSIVEAIVREQLSILSISAVSDALTEVFTSIANGSATTTLGHSQYAIMDTLMKTLDAQQKGVIGIRLRALLFAESVEPQAFAVPLAKYGHLIPDVQPSNPHEVLRIVLFLDYLSRSSANASALAAFFDTRAEQIAAFKYSIELRKTMGEAVAKLSEITPSLYKRFAQAKGFVRLIQSLKRGALDRETERDE